MFISYISLPFICSDSLNVLLDFWATGSYLQTKFCGLGFFSVILPDDLKPFICSHLSLLVVSYAKTNLATNSAQQDCLANITLWVNQIHCGPISTFSNFKESPNFATNSQCHRHLESCAHQFSSESVTRMSAKPKDLPFQLKVPNHSLIR
jgi:hypothetical protein